MSLGTGALKVIGEGPEVIQAPQGGLHGNPASGNHPYSPGLGDRRFPMVGQHGTPEKRLQAPLSPITDSLMPLGENQLKTSLPGSKGSTAMLKETPAGDDELRRPPWQAKANHASFRERDAKAADGVLM